MARALEPHRVKWPLLEQRAHGVGDLYLANRSRLSLLDLFEDVRCQDESSNDFQIRGRLGEWRFFYHVFDFENTIFHLVYSQGSETRNCLAGNLHRSNNGRFILFVNVE